MIIFVLYIGTQRLLRLSADNYNYKVTIRLYEAPSVGGRVRTVVNLTEQSACYSMITAITRPVQMFWAGNRKRSITEGKEIVRKMRKHVV